MQTTLCDDLTSPKYLPKFNGTSPFFINFAAYGWLPLVKIYIINNNYDVILAVCQLPESEVCVLAPPSSSWVTSSVVTA